MGLDVYVYTKAEQEANDAFEQKWDAYPEDGVSGYSTWSDEKKKQYHEELGKLPSSQNVPSKDYPDNINGRRYLRSSYNAGGFNRVVPEVTGRADLDYYSIFAPLMNDDQYLIKVDDPAKVAECRKRALECARLLEEAAKEPVYRVDSVRAQPLRPQDTGGAMDDTKALAMFHQERGRHTVGDSAFGNYGSALGEFFFSDPLEVVGAMPGVSILGAPCVHLVYRTQLHHSYIESAKVLVEFCDELLDLVATDGCAYIHWSG